MNAAQRVASPSIALIVLLAAIATPAHAADHHPDASITVSLRLLGEFDETEAGFGARLSYRVSRWLAVDGEVGDYPGDIEFSPSRFEWLAGVRVGPQDGTSGFLGLRAGTVRFAKVRETFACAAIFPPPLVCTLAGGETVPALQATGGFQALRGDRLFVRLEAGDQLLRYPGPALTPDGERFDDHRWSHNLKATISFGLRF